MNKKEKTINQKKKKKKNHGVLTRGMLHNSGQAQISTKTNRNFRVGFVLDDFGNDYLLWLKISLKINK